MIQNKPPYSVFRVALLTVLAAAVLLSACSGSADTSDATTSTSSVAASTVAITTTTTEAPPPIKVVSYSPNDSSPIEVLVVLRGDEHLFDPAAEVIGGSGELTFAWDFDGDPETVESDQMDPDPVTLEPGEYFPTLNITDQAGQVLTVELPRVIKIGDPPAATFEFGVAAHVNLSQGIYENEAEIETALDLIASAGIEAVRMDFSWAVMEPQEGSFNFGDYDRMVEMIKERDLEILGIIDGTPGWAAPDPTEPLYWQFHPEDSDEYGRFVGRLVSRFAEDVHTWEIWQEPNLILYFRGIDDPNDYAPTYFELLQAGYVAAKYADPGATVLVGGLANDPVSISDLPGVDTDDFLIQLYDLGALSYSDGMTLHPYTDPYLGIDTLMARIQKVRDVMVANGAADQLLWITEIGYPTGYQVWSESLMADWLNDSYDAMRAEPWIGPIVWYNFREKGEEANSENRFGMVRRDFTPKLTYFAYRAYVERAASE